MGVVKNVGFLWVLILGLKCESVGVILSLIVRDIFQDLKLGFWGIWGKMVDENMT